MARSRAIEGPYELHPSVHLLTSKDAARRTRTNRRDAERAGLSHSSLLEAAQGREALAAGARDGNPKVRPGRGRLATSRPRRPGSRRRRPGPVRRPDESQPSRQTYSFSPDAGLPLDFQWLRTPHPERIFSLTGRAGWLRLHARESIGSWFEQALVARRQEHFVYRAETGVHFHPCAFQHAGWPDRLLQPHEVPLPRRRLGREGWPIA